MQYKGKKEEVEQKQPKKTLTTPISIIGKREVINYKMAKPFKEMIMKKISQRKSAKK